MVVFDVRCRVMEAIEAADAVGNKVTIEPGEYRLRGIEHLVRNTAAGTSSATGTDFILIAAEDGGPTYTVSAESLAEFIADDDVEVRV